MKTSVALGKLNSEAGVPDSHSHQSQLEPVAFKVVVLCPGKRKHGEREANISLLKEIETEFLRIRRAPREKCHHVVLLMGFFCSHGWEPD